MLLQFQVQVAELFDAPDPDGVSAADHFRYLPPVGVLPVKAGGFNGFDLQTFFGDGVLGRPEYVGSALVRSLFKESAGHEPLDLSKGEPVRLYKTWLTPQIVAEGRAVQPSVVFASPYMTHLVESRFDVARFDQSTYAGGHTGDETHVISEEAVAEALETLRKRQQFKFEGPGFVFKF